MSYFEAVKPTYIENWPDELCRLSIAQVDVPLDLETARNLGSNMHEYGDSFGIPTADIRDLEFKLATIVENKFPKGAFIRLGSRSPKDACFDGDMHISTGDNPLKFLIGPSERICDDLHLALKNEYPPHIFVRQWCNIPQWAEFRCFMKNKKLVGISQYHYFDGAFAEISKDPKWIVWVINQFVPMFTAAIHLDDVVFDVFFKITEQSNQRQTEVKLLEINPFMEMTDPCLFDWRSDFDRTFRFLSQSTGTLTSIRL